jgi:hypothetical protein
MPDERDQSRPRRAQSSSERDVEGMKARLERDSAAHEAIPEAFEGPETVTGNYEGETLREFRRQRPTGERLDRLEVKHDSLDAVVTETRVAVGRIEGKLEVLPKLVSIIETAAQARNEREHVTFTSQVSVDTAREQAKIEVEKAGNLSKLEISQAKELDLIKARQVRRKRNAKIVGSVIGLVTSWEIMKWGLPSVATWIASHL